MKFLGGFPIFLGGGGVNIFRGANGVKRFQGAKGHPGGGGGRLPCPPLATWLCILSLHSSVIYLLFRADDDVDVEYITLLLIFYLFSSSFLSQSSGE